MRTQEADAQEFYRTAKDWVLRSRFSSEVSWQCTVRPEAFSEVTFLREAAWVILCTGFKESIVRAKLGYVSLCFFDWSSAELIHKNSSLCVATALHGFANHRKIKAIAKMAELIAESGFPNLKQSLLCNPIATVRKFPYIGPITARHLLKNLGFDVAKADRHLARLAARLRFSNVKSLCEELALSTGDPIRVIDVILWRFCEQHSGAARGISVRTNAAYQSNTAM